MPPSPPGRGGGAAQRSLDWDVAAATAARLMRTGPEVPREEAVRAVRGLRRASAAAETHVRELTGLGLDLPVLEGDVVDRREWVRAAAHGLAELTGLALSSRSGGSELGARGAGVQAGLVLSYLGTKVLGQYDPFLPGEHGGEPGRLLLVAPNIVAAQRALGVPAADFTMWVCLHESTHRLQFNAVPWLRDHFADSLGVLLSDLDSSPGELLGRLPAVVRGLRAGPDERSSPGMLGVVELLQGPRQRAALDRILALSTLLEGHADHVMDAVGPSVVPSVATIRRRFTERRQGGGLLDRLLRSILGVDAKMRQYAQGAAFTRHVVDRVGMDGFNAVWSSPEHLPTRSETTEPESWVRRVHG
ncbi:zinc-dependent metalloprotease [Saccharopolyspora sp. MS10]|uniref:zinc-dependent metalloprotease n=1 Tax=Saccharopolyspora sp. MS10 TaxID=3385973 RepID=UPI00399FAC40